VKKTYSLNRPDLEDHALNPITAAYEIHNQLGFLDKAIDLEALATCLDITEIRYVPDLSFEGMLITTPEKGEGKVIINANSDISRQRFTLAHEIGHYILSRHTQTHGHSFQCQSKDMEDQADTLTALQDRYQIQEQEANRFASELLMPNLLIESYLERKYPLQGIKALASKAKVSIAAAARRYTSITHRKIVVVFSHNSYLQYIFTSKSVSDLKFSKGMKLPLIQVMPSRMTECIQANPHFWAVPLKFESLTQQTLYQRHGYEVTVLELF